MDLAAYRHQAEQFVAELTGEYYRHYAGLKDDFAVEAIYQRHAALFERPAVEELRALHARAAEGEERRRLRWLLDFAVEGHMGQATKQLDAELARREAELQLEVDGRSLGFRESSVAQANEPDAERRARIEAAQIEATVRDFNPLRAQALELQHDIARQLGWGSYRAMCEELKGIDFDALAGQTAAFAAATEEAYPSVLEPALARAVGVRLDQARRSDLPRFFRAADSDQHFPPERLVSALEDTLRGLGIELRAQRNILLDVESRPRKSPRAFCAPVHVPGEIHLVVAPIGGRDDYAALLHEAGHAEHFATADPALPFEFRHLGDNSVTEAFAFLFDHLTEDPEWLRRRRGVDDHGELSAHARAQRLLFLRRYGAKLAYELELHDGRGRGDRELADGYQRRLTDAVRIGWPRELYLTDVDPGFYVAAYLRAWALETHLRALLRDRFGEAWFESPAAGDLLRELWSQGQRLDAAELLYELTGAELDFGAMLADLAI